MPLARLWRSPFASYIPLQVRAVADGTVAVTWPLRGRYVAVTSNGVGEIKGCSFFSTPCADSPPINWGANLWQMESEFKPDLKDPLDTSNFHMNELARVNANRMRSQARHRRASATCTCTCDRHV